MHLRKHLSLSVLALGITTLSSTPVAFAGTYTPPTCTSLGVSVPCDATAYGAGFELFFVNATVNDQLYAYNEVFADNNQFFDDLDSDYDIGFELNASFRFGTGKDLTARWEHIDTSVTQTRTTLSNGFGQTVSLTGFDITNSSFFDNNDFVIAGGTPLSAKFKYDFDAVDLEMGQHIDLGDNMDLRVHAGLQYLHIDFTKSLDEITCVERETYIEMETDTDAIGGRVGVDAAYFLGKGFHLVGHASFSLLMGDIDTELRGYSDTANDRKLVLRETHHFESDYSVIPAGMLKTGLNFGTDILNGHAMLEAGWRWEGFYQSLRWDPQPGSAFENFTFSGPYLMASFLI